jgi:uncharacterized protein YcsI (UPF0317 family)
MSSLACHLPFPDIGKPSYGDVVTIQAGEVPVFWACGVTPQQALTNAKVWYTLFVPGEPQQRGP